MHWRRIGRRGKRTQHKEAQSVSTEETPIDQWCILELMGHVRLAGCITEESHFGVALGRIDIPTAAGDGYTTQYFGGASIYRLTPTTEEIARSVAAHSQPRPVQSWELPRPQMLEADPNKADMDEDEQLLADELEDERRYLRERGL